MPDSRGGKHHTHERMKQSWHICFFFFLQLASILKNTDDFLSDSDFFAENNLLWTHIENLISVNHLNFTVKKSISLYLFKREIKKLYLFFPSLKWYFVPPHLLKLCALI